MPRMAPGPVDPADGVSMHGRDPDRGPCRGRPDGTASGALHRHGWRCGCMGSWAAIRCAGANRASTIARNGSGHPGSPPRPWCHRPGRRRGRTPLAPRRRARWRDAAGPDRCRTRRCRGRIVNRAGRADHPLRRGHGHGCRRCRRRGRARPSALRSRDSSRSKTVAPTVQHACADVLHPMSCTARAGLAGGFRGSIHRAPSLGSGGRRACAGHALSPRR